MRTQEEIEMLEAAQEKQKHTYVSITSIPPTSDHEGADQASLPKTPTLLDRADKWWLWEFIAWTIAVLSLIGIIILLRVLEDKRVPEWKIRTTALGKTVETKITINAIISIFSTILKSTIMIPIAASMSQLKWLWFHDGNKLSDVQLFDAANRGPLGSVILIWQMRGRRIVCLGALVIITMLGLDFSFQSIVTYPPKATRIATSTTPTTNTYTSIGLSAPSYAAGIQKVESAPQLRNVIRSFVYDIDTTAIIKPNCPTGNCTWTNQYASVGICSECHDGSNILNKSCGVYERIEQTPFSYCNYSWPGTAAFDEYFDTYFNMVPGIPWYLATGATSDGTPIPYTTVLASDTYWPMEFNYFFKDSPNLLSILSVLRPTWTDGNLTSVEATQCALKLCVKKYEAKMENNIYTENLVDFFENKTTAATAALFTGTSDTTEFVITPPDSFFENMDPTTPKTFTTSLDVGLGIWNLLKSFTGSIIADPLMHEFGHTDAIDHLQNLSYAGIDQMMSSMAGNMTNVIRMSNANGTSATNSNAQGDVMQFVPFVNVRWAWLALPIFELVLTFVLLLSTMRASTRHQGMLWKGSALAPFYHPLTKDGREKVGAAMSPRQMENVATGLNVKWENTDRGLRLVQH